MMIHKMTPSIDYNQWLFKGLDNQLNEATNQNFKVPKVDKSTNKKMLFKTLGTSVINKLFVLTI